MSLKFRDKNGNETPIAGLNGTSGELIPSVSKYQSGTVTIEVPGNSGNSIDVTFTDPMPDEDYVVTLSDVGSPLPQEISTRNLTKTGFQIAVLGRTSGGSSTLTVKWQAFKLMTDESRALDEQAIADNTSAITELKAYGKKVLWSGTATKGGTVSFDGTGYDELYAIVGGAKLRCVSMGRGSNARCKFCENWNGRDTYTSTDMQGLYAQIYVLDILDGGQVATCAWFHIDMTNGEYKSENSVNVTQIIGVKYPTIS